MNEIHNNLQQNQFNKRHTCERITFRLETGFWRKFYDTSASIGISVN